MINRKEKKMFATRSQRFALAVVLAAVLATASGVTVYAVNRGGEQSDLAQIRGALAGYHQTAEAEAAGWILVEGLDHCFDNPGVGAMGIHYINPELLDTTLDPMRPEALVFHHLPNGKLQLGAVEYIVPVEAWHDEHGPYADPPELLGEHFHQLEPVPGVHVYGLHVWLFTQNPDGMFANWNPRISCPAE
jgi:hypothetical protein